MKLAIQAYFLNQPHTGIGVHTRELSKALLDQKHKCTLIVTERTRTLPKKNQMVVPEKKWIPIRGLRKWYWEAIQVPATMAKLNVDWEIYPYPVPLPRYSTRSRALTVHDTILWTDERYRKSWSKRFYHEHTKKSLARVDQIFTVSQATKEDLALPTAVVIGNSTPTNSKNKTQLSYENALVYLGGYDVRKQVPKLVEAFKHARKKRPELQLLLIGKAHHQSALYPAIPQTEGVVHLGALTDEQVQATLQSARAFVHFSDSEGFNIPLLQAMKAGVPAIVADIAVNREVSKGAALFVDPSKKDPLSVMLKKLEEPEFRKECIAKQKQATKGYSWTKIAQRLVKTLESHA